MITDIVSYLPLGVLSNDQIAILFPDWSADKILEKTGIEFRHIAAADETAGDLAARAATALLARHGVACDWLLFCTQSPDYLLPTTACVLQNRLGLPTTCAALDFNLGCSGYIYGLSLAQALLSSGQARRVLLLTGETYTKLLDPSDKGTRTIFGDAGTATLLDSASPHRLHSFVLGTDGRGEKELIVATGGARHPSEAPIVAGAPNPACLFMNGPEIFSFTLRSVPGLVNQVLAKASLTINDIDLFVFHQANAYMLEHLRRKIGIPQEKFAVHFAHCGNTVSSTIPMVLEHFVTEGRIIPGMKLLLAGFGVGFSWGGCILEWR